MKNFGVIRKRTPTDYVAGTLPYEVRLDSGNWNDYLPPGEWQRGSDDSMACVTFSLLNCIETQEFFLTGKRVNYSDRWIAKMSGTTHDGNYLTKVADTVRQYGLVLEEDYPTLPNFTWDEYYQDIPEPLLTQLKVKGADWKKTHTLEYEWLDNYQDTITKHLKHCPLQVVKPGHAIENYNQSKETENIFDSYDPFKKQLQRADLLDVFKPLLTIKSMNQTKVVLSKDGKTVYVATPIATDWANFQKQASVEGIDIPNPIPPSSSL